MRVGTKTALAVGIVGALGLGMWAGNITVDRLMKREPAPPPQVAQAEPAPAPVAIPVRKTAARRKAPVELKAAASAPAIETSSVAVTSPDLQDRLRKVLFKGTKVELAAEGFHDGLQFATFAHASRNTMVPLILLKHRVLNQGMTLAEAIHESKPDVDAIAEAARARDMAKADIDSVVSAN